MPLQFEPYLDQLRHWPTDGRHILAQFDDESILVYQAYRPEIARSRSLRARRRGIQLRADELD